MRFFQIILFAVLTLGLLYALLDFTKFNDNAHGYLIKATFKDTAGIRKGAPVTLVGVEIGKVEDITLNKKDRGVIMHLRLEEKVPNDSKLKIVEKGMLGEMYLLFNYGVSQEFYADGEMIEGKKPISLQDVVGDTGGTVKDLGKEAQQFIQTLHALIKDEALKKNIYKTLEELPKTIQSVRKLVDGNQNQINTSVAKLAQTMDNVNSLVTKIDSQLKVFEDEEIVKNLGSTFKNFNAISTSFNSTEMNQVILKSDNLLTKLNDSSAELAPALKEMNKIFKAVNVSGGSAGKLIYDPSVYDNLNTFLKTGTELLELLKEKPNALIFGRKNRKSTNTEHLKRNNKKNNRFNSYQVDLEK